MTTCPNTYISHGSHAVASGRLRPANNTSILTVDGSELPPLAAPALVGRGLDLAILTHVAFDVIIQPVLLLEGSVALGTAVGGCLGLVIVALGLGLADAPTPWLWLCCFLLLLEGCAVIIATVVGIGLILLPLTYLVLHVVVQAWLGLEGLVAQATHE